jgi:SAM-dependent methyltransferase
MEVEPISKKYGFDRGKPIDRYFIEQFLWENRQYIKGKCLEIVDSTYTKKYGGKNVTTSDALDIFPTRNANIHGDLRNLTQVEDNVYDCLIVTQTFNVIDNYHAAIKECFRILKPGGTLLVTVPTVSPCWNVKINLWRYTPEAALSVFGQYFGKKNTQVTSYGNNEVATSFWIGFSKEDLAESLFSKQDADSPLIVGVRAIKNI